MRLVIQDDADAVATWVSEYIVDRINAFKPTPTKPFVIGVLSLARLQFQIRVLLLSNSPPAPLSIGHARSAHWQLTHRNLQGSAIAKLQLSVHCWVRFQQLGRLIPLLLSCGSHPFSSRPPTSPPEQQQKLVQAFNDGRVSFKNVITFNMDE